METGGGIGAALPKSGPFAYGRVRKLAQLQWRNSGSRPRRGNNPGGEKSEGIARREVTADVALIDVEGIKPYPNTKFGRIVKMEGFFVERLEKSSVNNDAPARLENTKNFTGCAFRFAEVFEDVEGKHHVEKISAEWQVMGICYDIGVPKNFLLHLDAVRVLRRSGTGAEMKDEVFTVPQYRFELRPERVAPVIGGRDLNFAVKKNSDAIVATETAGTARALQLRAAPAKRSMAMRANENGKVIHSRQNWASNLRPSIGRSNRPDLTA
jgi:hypothetical protein